MAVSVPELEAMKRTVGRCHRKRKTGIWEVCMKTTGQRGCAVWCMFLAAVVSNTLYGENGNVSLNVVSSSYRCTGAVDIKNTIIYRSGILLYILKKTLQ